MTNDGKRAGGPAYLGIEAGGTRTIALLEERDRSIQREFGPANLRLMTDKDLLQHFSEIARDLPGPKALAIGMAGARTETDRRRIQNAAAKAWPRVPCYATDDLETALAAVRRPKTKRPAVARVLIVSGTGSCCFGQRPDGATAKVGGWGHILGDKGSGYEIGLRALKAVVYYLDRDQEWSHLGQRLLRALQLNEPNDLITWVLGASKKDIAALAVEVFSAWAKGDRIARDILEGAAECLAHDAVACARRLAKPQSAVQFVLSGSVLRRQPRFARWVCRNIKQLWSSAIVAVLKEESVQGAVTLARERFPESEPLPPRRGRGGRLGAEATPAGRIASISLSPTEQRNPRSMNLDRMPIGKAVEMMLREDARIPPALMAERRGIERGVKFIVRSFKRGGRLFYAGAGTSGRLGVLDASECPPTFRTDPELVQGIIAGGQTAIWQAVEGAEDDPDAGARAMVGRGIDSRDTVVGIAASGRTPFVWGALREAKKRGATTMLLCFNPSLIVSRRERPDLILAPRIGPEILTGSTRLKSGTATKLILNIFTTLAMVRIGKVLGNLMIDVKASNVKLRDRAVRIVCELTGVDYARAQQALERSEWRIKTACARLGRR